MGRKNQSRKPPFYTVPHSEMALARLNRQLGTDRPSVRFDCYGPGEIYIMYNTSTAGGGKKRPDGLVKIGRTNDLTRRLDQARNPKTCATYRLRGYNLNPANNKYKHTFSVSNMKGAEDLIFSILSADRVEPNREFFYYYSDRILNDAMVEVKKEFGLE